MIESELICGLARVEELTPEWDALAVSNGAPESAPAWMLGWWRHLAPADAELRVVAVRERDELIGIVPMYVEPSKPGSRHRYHLLANDFSGSLTPLALPDRVGGGASRGAHALTGEASGGQYPNGGAAGRLSVGDGAARTLAGSGAPADPADGNPGGANGIASPGVIRHVAAIAQFAISQQSSPAPATFRRAWRDRTDEHQRDRRRGYPHVHTTAYATLAGTRQLTTGDFGGSAAPIPR